MSTNEDELLARVRARRSEDVPLHERIRARRRSPPRLGEGELPIERVPQGFARGVEDVGEGIKQLWLQFTDPDAAEEYTEQVRRGREEEGDVEPVSRFMGQMLPLAPLALVPGGASGSLLTRLASGAAAGGAAGGTMFAPSGTKRERAFNVGVGAAGGATLPEVARGGARGVAALVRRLTGRSGPTDEALARQAEFEALGVRPTTGQVTRNPTQLARERNVGQLPGVGDEVRAVRAGQSGQLSQALDEAVPGEQLTQTEAGRRVMGTLGSRFDDEGIYRRMGRQIDELYEAARNAPGADDALPFDDFAQRISGVVDDFEDAIPPAVKRRLAQFGDDRAFTVGEAIKLRQLVNKRSRATNDPATAAGLSSLKRQLDDFLGGAAEQGVGADALGTFQQARQAANRRARAFDTRGLQEVVSDQADPDNFVKRFVIGAPVDDVRQMRVTLLRQGGDEGASAWDVTRRQVADYLMDKSVNDAGSFSAAGYNRALERIGPEKLRVLFNEEEAAQLQRIGRAATNLFSDPPSGGIPVGNRSGTAAANVSNVPGMSFLERISKSRVANQALAGSPVDRIGNAQRNAATATGLTNPMGANPFGVFGGLAGLMQARNVLEGNR